MKERLGKQGNYWRMLVKHIEVPNTYVFASRFSVVSAWGAQHSFIFTARALCCVAKLTQIGITIRAADCRCLSIVFSHYGVKQNSLGYSMQSRAT